MLKDQDFLHGAAFLRLINHGIPVRITSMTVHPSIYLVEADVTEAVILFKVSTKPTSAWSFGFSSQEASALSDIHSQYPNYSAFIGLICHRDGICCLAEKQLLELLTCTNLGGQRVSVSRKPKESYHVNGTGRVSLERTIPQKNFPSVIFKR